MKVNYLSVCSILAVSSLVGKPAFAVSPLVLPSNTHGSCPTDAAPSKPPVIAPSEAPVVSPVKPIVLLPVEPQVVQPSGKIVVKGDIARILFTSLSDESEKNSSGIFTEVSDDCVGGDRTISLGNLMKCSMNFEKKCDSSNEYSLNRADFSCSLIVISDKKELVENEAKILFDILPGEPINVTFGRIGGGTRLKSFGGINCKSVIGVYPGAVSKHYCEGSEF